MSPPTFHLFSQLPCELRLQVWESAIRECTKYNYDFSPWICVPGEEDLKPESQKKHTYGINYVCLDSRGDYIPLDCSWNKPHPANRSAYLWHAGLWMACKESREVMRKRLFHSPCSKGHLDDVDKQVNCGLRKWFYGNEEGVDVIWNGWGRKIEPCEPWLMATSRGDMFCITPDNHRPLTRFKLFRQSSEFCIYKYAVEFDPAWVSELAGLDKYQPTHRLSPTLAFAIKVFCGIATQERSLPSVIHLIDRYSGWKRVSNAEELSVHYDCEHEYIQIDPSNPLARNRLIRSTPMLRFLDQVDRLLKYTLTWKRKTSPRAWGDYGLPPDGLSVRKLVRVMARRDKEVVPMITTGNAIPPNMRQSAPVIDLTEDICCINTDSWGSLLRPWKPIYVQTEDARGQRRLKKPRNIGVKFDTSWEEELENAVQNTGFATVLRDFSPPLAFMIRLLFEVAPNDFPGQSKVMLIDDVSEWQ
ncbi:hypothetical protein FBULB1_8985 [Fusarium bulbicola]|nr:hypothetical protein FBULB1_8985 [Fusarium bulbicola]